VADLTGRGSRGMMDFELSSNQLGSPAPRVFHPIVFGTTFVLGGQDVGWTLGMTALTWDGGQ
jgi:hypothetical protein